MGVMVVSVLLLLSSFAILVMKVPSQIAIFSFQMFPEYLVVVLLLLWPWWLPYMYLPSYGKRSNAYRGYVKGVIDETGITIEAEYLSLLLMWRLNSGTLSRTEIAQAYYWLRDHPRNGSRFHIPAFSFTSRG